MGEINNLHDGLTFISLPGGFQNYIVDSVINIACIALKHSILGWPEGTLSMPEKVNNKLFMERPVGVAQTRAG